MSRAHALSPPKSWPSLLLLLGASAAFAQSPTDAPATVVPLLDPARPYTLTVHVHWGEIDLRPSPGPAVELRALDDDGAPAPVQLRHEGNAVSLRQPPPDVGSFESANLALLVPPGGQVHVLIERGGNVRSQGLDADLEVNNLNGSVDVLDHTGSATVNATNGTIRAELVQPNDRVMMFTTLNGSAHLCLGSGATPVERRVLLSTRENQIVTDFEITRAAPARSVPAGSVLTEGADLLDGTLGGGGPLLRVSTANGDILLRRCRQ